MRYNHFGQAIGETVEGFQEGEAPTISTLEGRTVRIEKVDQRHEKDLYNVYGPTSPAQYWTYLSITPFARRGDFHQYLMKMIASTDPYYLTIIDKASDQAVGTFALMRADTKNRVIEMGTVIYSNQLQQTRQATEAQYLVMKYVFETLNYRRYEWKCDRFNEPSKQAAIRLGFTYEGTFRQAIVYKGRNRDTDWFSLLDTEWPEKKQILESWLADSNFDSNGHQLTSLSLLHSKAHIL